MRDVLKSTREVLMSMREVLKSTREVLKSMREFLKSVRVSQSVRGLGNLWRTHGVAIGVPMVYPWRTYIVGNGNVAGNGNINSVTSLS